MPLTAKGSEILARMQSEYGEAKGKEVFYASRNAGKISGVDAKDMSGEKFEELSRLISEWLKEESDEKEHAVDGLAFDKFEIDLGPKSARKYDANGFLHIRCHISKACVNPYWGREIPDYERLGLDADKLYKLFRDPAELAKGASTFNNLPLLTRHVPQSSAEPSKDLRVGSLGTDTEFINPYLDNTLVIWDDESQAGVDSGQKRELSSSYRYTADMTPGEHQGVDYDGRMTAIYGNHVALVEAGRAGPDVIVGDAQLGQGDFIMAVKPRTSHRATLALGAITGFVSPRLAADAKLDATGITAILKDTTAKNWLQRKPRLATALSTALGKVKLANDAKPEPDEIHRLLDSLDAIVGDEEMDDGAEDETETEEERAERMEDRAEDRKHGLDAAADEDPETEEEKKKRMEARDRKVRRANDARRKLGHDESEEEKKKREDEEKAEDRKAKAADRVMRAKDKRPGMDRGAMDAAIKKAVKDTEDRVIARLNGIAQAKADVLPYVADFTGAADSAEEIYRFALDQAGVAHDGIREIAALKAMVGLLPKPGDPALAVDHAATLNRGTPSDDWLKSFNVPV